MDPYDQPHGQLITWSFTNNEPHPKLKLSRLPAAHGSYACSSHKKTRGSPCETPALRAACPAGSARCWEEGPGSGSLFVPLNWLMESTLDTLVSPSTRLTHFQIYYFWRQQCTWNRIACDETWSSPPRTKIWRLQTGYPWLSIGRSMWLSGKVQ